MKTVMLALALILLSGCSSTTELKTSPNNTESTTVRNVTGVGSSYEEAKNNAFNIAIEKVVGSVILVDKELRANRLVKDDIMSHSSGYVDDYRIRNVSNSNNKITMVMDVDIKHSRIAERFLGSSSTPSSVNGTRMATQFNSYLKNRESGDRLVEHVLGDFPNNAFTVTMSNIDYVLTTDRDSLMVINYEFKWNYNYVRALNEMLSVLTDAKNDTISQQKLFVQSKPPENLLFGRTDGYYFNDSITANKIKRKLALGTVVVAKVSDHNGNVLFTKCSVVDYMGSGPNITNVSHIQTSYWFKDKIEIKIPSYGSGKEMLTYAQNVKLEVQPEGYCASTAKTFSNATSF